jgi:hypothetical protein
MRTSLTVFLRRGLPCLAAASGEGRSPHPFTPVSGAHKWIEWMASSALCQWLQSGFGGALPVTAHPQPGHAMQPFLLILLLALFLTYPPLFAQSLPNFAPYGNKGSFSYFVGCHTNAAARTNLLLMTAFLSYNSALQYIVRSDGFEYDYAEVTPTGGHKAGRQRRLSTNEVARLSEAIRRFPAYDRVPPIGNLLVVSFMRGTNWTTHSYNWDSPPTPVREAFAIIGERKETNHKPIK